MTIANDHDIKVLNGLLEAVLDSVDGYREAARETDQTRYRGLFEQRAEELDPGQGASRVPGHQTRAVA